MLRRNILKSNDRAVNYDNSVIVTGGEWKHILFSPGIYHLFTGGRYKVGDDRKSEDQVLVFNTETKTLRQLGEMKVARGYHAVSLVDDNGECQ